MELDDKTKECLAQLFVDWILWKENNYVRFLDCFWVEILLTKFTSVIMKVSTFETIDEYRWRAHFQSGKFVPYGYLKKGGPLHSMDIFTKEYHVRFLKELPPLANHVPGDISFYKRGKSLVRWAICDGKTVAHILLTQAKAAIIDPESVEEICKHKWYAINSKYGFKAVTRVNGSTVHMNRMIMNGKGPISHVNGNALDNRIKNLYEI